MNPFAHFRTSKNRNSLALFAVAIIAVGFGASGCAKLKARDELNKGVAAYRDGKYDQAIEFFKSAKDNDPTLTNAQLYLATAYATQYIPGAPSEENIRMGEAAVKLVGERKFVAVGMWTVPSLPMNSTAVAAVNPAPLTVTTDRMTRPTDGPIGL